MGSAKTDFSARIASRLVMPNAKNAKATLTTVRVSARTHILVRIAPKTVSGIVKPVTKIQPTVLRANQATMASVA